MTHLATPEVTVPSGNKPFYGVVPTALIARMSGDEFVVVHTKINVAHDADKLRARSSTAIVPHSC